MVHGSHLDNTILDMGSRTHSMIDCTDGFMALDALFVIFNSFFLSIFVPPLLNRFQRNMTKNGFLCFS